MVSMKEIAEMCGVSVGTVSKALANQPGVSARKSRTIREVATRFNYRPNALVRGMQSGRTMSVAIACNSVEDPWTSMVLRGCLFALHEVGYEAWLLQWDLGVRSGEHMLRAMGERRADGILMFPPASEPTADYLEELRTFPGPVVMLDQHWNHQEFHFVGSDDRQGMLMALTHLFELGHTDIGCISYPQVTTGRVRLDAFIEGMSRHGLQVRDEWLASAATYEDGQEAARLLLARSNRPTAIVCFTDLVAWGALNAASDLGLDVPGDLSLVGFSDLPLAKRLRPRLTTVAQPNEVLGQRGVELLIERINQGGEQGLPREPRTLLLPTDLIIRESTGPIKR